VPGLYLFKPNAGQPNGDKGCFLRHVTFNLQGAFPKQLSVKTQGDWLLVENLDGLWSDVIILII
jgi:hypothetical protein